MKSVGGWDFYIIKVYYYGKILKCIELKGHPKSIVKGTEYKLYADPDL